MMFLSIVLLLAAISVSLWGWWLKIVRSGSGSMVKGSLPIIGYTHKIIGDTEKSGGTTTPLPVIPPPSSNVTLLCYELYKVIEDISNDSLANGGVSRIILIMKTYYVVSDPEDLTTVGNKALKKHFSFDFAKPWLGDGLLTAPTSQWKHHRKLLSPAFSLNLLHSFLQIFNEQAAELVDSLAEQVGKGFVDISHYFKENAMNALSQTSLGLSKKENTDFLPNYIRAADEATEMIVTRFLKVWLHSDLVYKITGLKKKNTNLIKVMDELADGVIKSNRLKVADVSKDSKNLATSDKTNNAFLDRLVKMATSGILSEKEIREEVATILVAGVDTSSWAMTYICVVLGTYPEIQKKVVQELTEIFGDSDRDVSKEDLQRLVFMDAVVKETLRLYPIVPVSLRTVESGIKLKKHYLRPGDHVIMSFYGCNRHPMWGADADQFRPERWLETAVPTVYAGFGAGKRSCIGQTYAIMTMKVLLSHLFRRYHFVGDVTKLKLKMDFIAKPVSGHLVSISERC